MTYLLYKVDGSKYSGIKFSTRLLFLLTALHFYSIVQFFALRPATYYLLRIHTQPSLYLNDTLNWQLFLVPLPYVPKMPCNVHTPSDAVITNIFSCAVICSVR